MGISVNKPSNNHRLFCYKLPKNETNPQNLVHTKERKCPFYAGLASEILTSSETIGSKMKIEYQTFTIETYDNVNEINEGDLIFITNFNQSFNVEKKNVIILRKGLTFSKLKDMPKAVRFDLRGKL